MLQKLAAERKRAEAAELSCSELKERVKGLEKSQQDGMSVRGEQAQRDADALKGRISELEEAQEELERRNGELERARADIERAQEEALEGAREAARADAERAQEEALEKSRAVAAAACGELAKSFRLASKWMADRMGLITSGVGGGETAGGGAKELGEWDAESESPTLETAVGDSASKSVAAAVVDARRELSGSLSKVEFRKPWTLGPRP
jgi:hypothetical protein